jgi:pilus assembly protein Flp/PilA
MLSPNSAIIDFLCEEDGATAVEYAVMLALIIAVCIASVSFLAAQTAESFNTSASAIAGAFGN